MPMSQFPTNFQCRYGRGTDETNKDFKSVDLKIPQTQRCAMVKIIVDFRLKSDNASSDFRLF